MQSLVNQIAVENPEIYSNKAQKVDLALKKPAFSCGSINTQQDYLDALLCVIKPQMPFVRDKTESKYLQKKILALSRKQAEKHGSFSMSTTRKASGYQCEQGRQEIQHAVNKVFDSETQGEIVNWDCIPLCRNLNSTEVWNLVGLVFEAKHSPLSVELLNRITQETGNSIR
jgi:hypothetical protein